MSGSHLYLSTRPEKHVGAEDDWELAEQALHEALKRSGMDYSTNEGDGAFYGPRIDICVTDALEREWQLSTIQFDFNLPERFELSRMVARTDFLSFIVVFWALLRDSLPFSLNIVVVIFRSGLPNAGSRFASEWRTYCVLTAAS